MYKINTNHQNDKIKLEKHSYNVNLVKKESELVV